MSIGCAGCGRCCDPVVLPLRQYARIVEHARRAEALEDNHRFIAEHWHIIGAFTDHLGDHANLRCDAFDSEARRCTAYEGRPPVCRDYPWYGDGPTPERARLLYTECSFLADVPPDQRPEGARPLIPLTVIRG